MSKKDTFKELHEIFYEWNSGQILELMFNWFDADDMKEFLEFVKEECND